MERAVYLRLCMLRQLAVGEGQPLVASALWSGVNAALSAQVPPDRMGLMDFRAVVEALVAGHEAVCDRQPIRAGSPQSADTWALTEPGRRALIRGSLALRPAV